MFYTKRVRKRPVKQSEIVSASRPLIYDFNFYSCILTDKDKPWWAYFEKSSSLLPTETPAAPSSALPRLLYATTHDAAPSPALPPSRWRQRRCVRRRSTSAGRWRYHQMPPFPPACSSAAAWPISRLRLYSPADAESPGLTDAKTSVQFPLHPITDWSTPASFPVNRGW